MKNMKKQLFKEIRESLKTKHSSVSVVLVEKIKGREFFGTLLSDDDLKYELIAEMSGSDLYYYFARNSYYFCFSKKVLKWLYSFEEVFMSGGENSAL